jgi:DNA-binding CsgD family transcriptional regulator
MATPVPAPRLRGREEELRALGDAVDRAAAGHLTTVIVEGEAGIGKTRLLADALDDARARGREVVTGRARELERTRPFGLLADAFGCVRSSPDPRRAALAALLATQLGGRGPLTVSSDPGLQFQAVDAFVDLVEELALHGPLVLAVDDLQWADPSSLLTLAALARRLTDSPVALVGCLRLLPRADELVGALLQEGAIQTVNGRAEVAETVLPPTLRLTILRRLSFLPEQTLEGLRAASILGSGFSLVELSTTTARSVLELSSVLAEALRARILEDDGDRLRFRHDLIHEAIYLDLPAGVRLALHREAGRRLAASGAAALRVAEHLARGAEVGDNEAVAWLTTAAREAAPKSPTIAADLLERAVGLSEPADPGRDRLLVERASALAWAGRLADAEATCRVLLDRDHDPSLQAQARICLGWILVAQGRMRDALRQLEPVQQSPAAGDQARATAWGWASMAHLSLGELDGAAAAAEQARPAAAAAGDHATTSLALTCLAIVHELRGDLRRAVRVIDDAARRADQSPGRQGHRYPLHVTRGHILLELDRLDDARHTLEVGRRTGEELGVRWAVTSYQVFLAVERFVAGAWDDAVAEFEAALELAAETGERYSLVLGHSVMSLIALRRGDLQHAEADAGSAARELAAGGPRYRGHWALWARALLLEAGGNVADAFATLDGCWDLCARSGLAIEYPALGPDLVRLALAAGEEDRAAQVAAAVAGVAARNDVPSLAGAALRCRGLVERDPTVLRSAVDAYAQGPRPLELALTAEDAGTGFARRGDAAAAAPLLHQALASYERLDAAREAARAEATLRELGIRRGRRGARRRPQLGWESLTPTEHRVVDLVVEGLSNPQIGERLFVSRRTVQTHLAHVFTKLGIAARAQLAAEAMRHRQPPRNP